MAKKDIFKNAKNGMIAPSILSADFSKLGDEINEMESFGADWIHVDVMDGHFVPNITIGAPVVKSIRPVTDLPLDCHLMVSDPGNWLEDFAKAGADIITIHAEVVSDLPEIVKKIKTLGCYAGVSVNPGTSLKVIEKNLELLDLVLIMSVNPGFGGQSFIESTYEKIKSLNELRGDSSFLIEVDGGVNKNNVKRLRDSGCDVFVAGSSIFNKSDRKKALEDLKEWK